MGVTPPPASEAPGPPVVRPEPPEDHGEHLGLLDKQIEELFALLDDTRSRASRHGPDSVGHPRKHTGDDHLYPLTGAVSMPPTSAAYVPDRDYFLRLENKIGVGVDPLANTVLRVGMPSGGAVIVNQTAFVGTKTQTGNNGLVTFVNFGTEVDTVGFTGTDIRTFQVSLSGRGAGTFDELFGFRLNNQMASDVTGRLAWFSFPHPSPGWLSGFAGKILAFDLGDFDDGAWLDGAYGLRISDRDGVDTQPFGLASMFAGATAYPIFQDYDTDTLLGLTGGSGDTYSVHAANFSFGANNPATAFVDIAASIAAYPSARIRVGVAPSSPLEGDIWNDSTRKSLTAYMAGIKQQDTRTLFTKTDDSTVANTASETALIGAVVGSRALPANFFTVGKTIRLRAWGYASYVNTAGQTLNIRVRLGGAGGTQVLTTGNIATVALRTNDMWYLEADITCRTTGAGGTVMSNGHFTIGPNTGLTTLPMLNVATVALDTTAAQTLELTADWNTAVAGDTITCTQCSLEVLN